MNENLIEIRSRTREVLCRIHRRENAVPKSVRAQSSGIKSDPLADPGGFTHADYISKFVRSL